MKSHIKRFFASAQNDELSVIARRLLPTRQSTSIQSCHPEPTCHPEYINCHPEQTECNPEFITCHAELVSASQYNRFRNKFGMTVFAKKAAFTLAEVLITLGIIGVVAAMTIPTLISNTNGARNRAQFKKVISTLNQAGKMSQAQYGFDFGGTNALCNTDAQNGAGEHPDNVMSICAIFNGTLAGATYYGEHTNIPIKDGYTGASGKNYYQINDVDAKTDWLTWTGASYFLAYQLSDGSIVAFHKSLSGCELPSGVVLTNDYIKTNLAKCIGWIDVNGTSLPNREVRCSSGKNSIDSGSNCIVKNDALHMNDVFPIVFHDGTVEPASGASLYVLKTAK